MPLKILLVDQAGGVREMLDGVGRPERPTPAPYVPAEPLPWRAPPNGLGDLKGIARCIVPGMVYRGDQAPDWQTLPFEKPGQRRGPHFVVVQKLTTPEDWKR